MTGPGTAFASLIECGPTDVDVNATAPGPAGSLPLTELLLHAPSGDLFGRTQDVGMGWSQAESGPQGVPHPQHPGRHPRPGRQAHRALPPGAAQRAARRLLGD